MKHLQNIRIDYKKAQLDEGSIPDEPMDFFQNWLTEALHSGEREPTAMALTTVSPEGKPSSRIVLLKDIKENKLVFYTNYESRKGAELEKNPNAALLFFWPSLERQLRIEGSVERLSYKESEAYFNSRPLESRIGASISPQSKIIASRDELEHSFTEEITKAQKGIPPVKPAFWGGYSLSPQSIEFWQGRPGRLHDRFLYVSKDGKWKKTRLAP